MRFSNVAMAVAAIAAPVIATPVVELDYRQVLNISNTSTISSTSSSSSSISLPISTTSSSSSLTTSSMSLNSTTTSMSSTVSSTSTTSSSSSTSSSLSNAAPSGFSYVGCLSGGGIDTTVHFTEAANSPEVCGATCETAGNYTFTAIDGTSCVCTNTASTSDGNKVSDSTCDTPCPGDPSQSCGGGSAGVKRQVGAFYSVFAVTNPAGTGATVGTNTGNVAFGGDAVAIGLGGAGGSATININGAPYAITNTTATTTVTTVVDSYVTYCPESTTFTAEDMIYTGMPDEWVTVGCPDTCTLTLDSAASASILPAAAAAATAATAGTSSSNTNTNSNDSENDNYNDSSASAVSYGSSAEDSSSEGSTASGSTGSSSGSTGSSGTTAGVTQANEAAGVQKFSAGAFVAFVAVAALVF